MINMQEQINIFKTKIKDQYPDLKIGHSYDAEENYYHIWHTNSHLQFEDDAFPGFIGGLIKKCFYSNDFFNFSFGYDYLEDEKSKIFYKVYTRYNNDIVFNFTEKTNTSESYSFQMIEKGSTFSWSKLDTINIALDSIDSFFFDQSIGQAILSVDSVGITDNQIEKALAA